MQQVLQAAMEQQDTSLPSNSSRCVEQLALSHNATAACMCVHEHTSTDGVWPASNKDNLVMRVVGCVEASFRLLHAVLNPGSGTVPPTQL